METRRSHSVPRTTHNMYNCWSTFHPLDLKYQNPSSSLPVLSDNVCKTPGYATISLPPNHNYTREDFCLSYAYAKIMKDLPSILYSSFSINPSPRDESINGSTPSC